MSNPSRRRAPWAGVMVISAAVAAAAWVADPASGTGSPVAPLRAEQLMDAALHVARWTLMLCSGYLTVVAAMHLLARRNGGRLERLANALTPRFATALLAVVIGASIPTVAGASDHDGDGGTGATMRRTEPAPQTWLPWVPHIDVTAVPAVVDEQPTPVEPTEVPTGPRLYIVENGDHFWSIAERQVAARQAGAGMGPGSEFGAEPDEHAVARYWLELVEHNRHRLVDPDNPDLIHAGLEIELP